MCSIYYKLPELRRFLINRQETHLANKIRHWSYCSHWQHCTWPYFSQHWPSSSRRWQIDNDPICQCYGLRLPLFWTHRSLLHPTAILRIRSSKNLPFQFLWLEYSKIQPNATWTPYSNRIFCVALPSRSTIRSFLVAKCRCLESLVV